MNAMRLWEWDTLWSDTRYWIVVILRCFSSLPGGRDLPILSPLCPMQGPNTTGRGSSWRYTPTPSSHRIPRLHNQQCNRILSWLITPFKSVCQNREQTTGTMESLISLTNSWSIAAHNNNTSPVYPSTPAAPQTSISSSTNPWNQFTTTTLSSCTHFARISLPIRSIWMAIW